MPGRVLKAGAWLVLLACLQALGDALVAWSGWPVSGSVVGLLLLLVLLSLRGGVPASLEAASAPLLGHLMLLLIPSVAAVVLHAPLLLRHGAVFAATAVVATALTVVATAWALQRLLRAQRP